jgi:hypothetical protein
MSPDHRIKARLSSFPPPETPAGAPNLGFLIAYEDPEARDGWSAGVVKAVDDGLEGKEFTVETRVGRFRVSRELVFYWWPPGSDRADPQFGQPRS